MSTTAYTATKAMAMAMTMVVALSACIRDGQWAPAPEPQGEHEVGFGLHVPRQRNAPTRGIADGSLDDSRVGEVVALVFDGGTGIYLRRLDFTGDDLWAIARLPGAESIWRIALRLPTGDYRMLFAANATKVIDGYIASLGDGIYSKTIEDFRSELSFPFSGKWNAAPASDGFRPFPMASAAGECDRIFDVPASPATQALLASSGGCYQGDMTRALSCINVFASEELGDPDDELGPAGTGFTLKQVVVCNYNDAVALAPSDIPGFSGDPAQDDIARIFDPGIVRPAGERTGFDGRIAYSDGEILSPVYGGNVSSTLPAGDVYASSGCVNEIFVPEQRAPQSATERNDALCVLLQADVTVGGQRYTGRWYRLSLIKTDPSDGERKHVNIARQVKYNLWITGVESTGFGTAREAYDNPSINGLAVDLFADIDRMGLDNIAFNDDYFLAVGVETPAGEIYEDDYDGFEGFWYAHYEFVKLYEYAVPAESYAWIYTDYPGGWHVESIEYHGASGPGTDIIFGSHYSGYYLRFDSAYTEEAFAAAGVAYDPDNMYEIAGQYGYSRIYLTNFVQTVSGNRPAVSGLWFGLSPGGTDTDNGPQASVVTIIPTMDNYPDQGYNDGYDYGVANRYATITIAAGSLRRTILVVQPIIMIAT